MTEHFPLPDGGTFDGSGNEAEELRSEARAPRRKRSVGRRWSRADKWRIVEESHQPGTSVSLVARRYDVNANQVFNWRREARDGRLGKPPAGIASRDEMTFLPLGVIGGSADDIAASATGTLAPSIPANLPAPAHAGEPAGVIEIELPGGIRVRVGSSVDVERLRRVLSVLKGA